VRPSKQPAPISFVDLAGDPLVRAIRRGGIAADSLKMSAYLIVTIALLPVSPIIKVVARVHNRFLTKFGADTKNDEEIGVAMIAGSVAIMIICLAFYAFIVLGILDLLGLLKFFMR
jgi:hypothetical protein